MKHILAALIFLASCSTAFAGQTYSYLPSPLPVANGGASYNKFAPSGSGKLILMGDSITQGLIGPSSCVSGAAPNRGVNQAVASLTGTCWADLIGKTYNMTVTNWAYGGAPLMHCVNLAYGGCTYAGIDIYAAIVNTATASDYVVISYGTNDATYSMYEPTFTPDAFKANLTTIVNAFIAKGVPASHIAILSVPFRQANAPYLFMSASAKFMSMAARVAQETATSFIDIYTKFSTGENVGGVFYTSNQLVTSGHPNDYGSLAIINAFSAQQNQNIQAFVGQYDADASIYGAGMGRPYQYGYTYMLGLPTMRLAGASSDAFVADTLYVQPMFFRSPTSLYRIGFKTGANNAGTGVGVKFCFYYAGSNGQPLNLIAGTSTGVAPTDASKNTGYFTAALSPMIQIPAGFVWGGVLTTHSGTGLITATSDNNSPHMYDMGATSTTNATTSTPNYGYTMNTAYADGCPASFTVDGAITNNNFVPIIWATMRF